MPMLAGEINTDSEGDEKGEDWTKVCSQKVHIFDTCSLLTLLVLYSYTFPSTFKSYG